jgi:hypothetical protein
MANLVIDLADIDELVTRRIAMDVVRGFINKFNLPHNTTILLPNSEQEDVLLNVENTDKNVQGYFSRMKFKLSIEDVHKEDKIGSSYVQRHDYKPLFVDNELGIVASPLYEYRTMTINFEVITSDKVVSEKLRTQIQEKFKNGARGFMHEAAYSYPLPLTLLGILTRIYRTTRFDQSAAAMSAWLYTHLDEQVAQVSTSATATPQLFKNEAQQLIQGKWDFVGAPQKGQSQRDGTQQTISFSYELNYERPYQIALDYPEIVHNKWIPAELRPKERKYSWLEKLSIPSRFIHWIHSFSFLSGVDLRDQGVAVPYFVQWFPRYYFPYTESLFRINMIVNENNLREVGNLGDLGEVNFKPIVLDYIRSCGQDIFTHRSSFIHVTLFEDNSLKGPESLVIDSDLNVSTTFDMDINKRYNLHITAYFFLRHIQPAAQTAIRRNPDLGHLILGGLDERLKTNGILPLPVFSGEIDKYAFDQCCQWIERNGTISIDTRHTLSRFIVGDYVLISP